LAKVLILGKIEAAGIDLLLEQGRIDVRELPDHSPDIMQQVGDADAIVVRMTRIDSRLIDAAPSLKVVARHGVGYEAVDVAALTARGIPLALVGDVNSGAVAEHTLAMMLAVSKRIVVHDRALRDGRFDVRDRFAATELADKTVLIVGFGRIGRRVAQHCAAFEMDVYVHDPFFGIDEVRPFGYKYSPILQDALEIADYVCLHVPKSAETVNLIGKPELASMKPTATLINVSRGGIVDEAALFDALSQGRLAGAALDVFEPEPPLTDNPLLSLDSVVLSPHCAAFTRECGRRMSVACARNVLAAFDGSLDPALVVNPETLG